MEFDCPIDDLCLEEVREDQYGEVVEAMKQYLPHSIHVQSSVAVTKHYGLADILGRKVFTPRHPDYRYKMVVVTPITTKKNLQSLQLFWSSSELHEDIVYHLLKTLPHFSWCEPFLVRLVPEQIHQQLSSAVSRLSAGLVYPRESSPVCAYIFEDPVPEPTSPGSEYKIGSIKPRDYSRVLSSMMLSAYEDPTIMETVFGRLPRIGIYKMLEVKENPQEKLRSLQRSKGESLPGKTGSSSEWDKVSHHITDPEEHTNPQPKTDVTSEQDLKRGDLLDEEEQQGITLVSWCTLKPAGDVGTTFTAEEHRGKKLARTGMLAAMKQAESMGTFPYSNVSTDNKASRTMLEKIGFRNKFLSCLTLYSDGRENEGVTSARL